ncbi:sulfurtransferase [Alteribacter aurantiacus]|uniref:sulfurtransferase n=1 Tax=Alteribacter aurantiacus TaxID=254410 RepID=UPI00041C18E0|nr:sulfurtransferase [Alteribacter aurantiacus]
MKYVLPLIIMSVLLMACSDDPSLEEIDEASADIAEGDVVDASAYENGHLLVDVDWVEENQEDVVLVDLRREGYEGGHIPGAVHLDSGELNDPDNPISGILKDEDTFQELIQSLGIDNGSTVIAYDDGDSLQAARLFYALELYGHEDVRIVNGGFTAWLTEGKDVSTDAPEVETGNFTAQLNPALQTSKEDVQNNIGNESAVILDTRSEGEYDGSDVRAERGGHIPGAPHLEWTEALSDDDVPYFKDPEALEEQFAAAGVDRDKTIIPYCQTNVRGAHSYFTLRLLGFDDIKPYEGSWAEWGNDPDTDIES